MKLPSMTIFLLMLATATAAQQDEGIFPFDYQLVELENGFKAYFIKAGAPGQIAYVSMVRTGSRDEVEPGEAHHPANEARRDPDAERPAGLAAARHRIAVRSRCRR